MVHGTTDILLSEGFAVDQGVHGARIALDAAVEVPCGEQDMLWAVALSDKVHCGSGVGPINIDLHRGESALLLWPRSPWSAVLSGDDGAEISVFRITLDALHRMLAVDFQSAKQAGAARMDYSKLSRVVRLSPVQLQALERLFIHSEQSRFRAIARRGIFLDAFAQMLETLYGTDIDQCPFHIDSDTERKIRSAEHVLVNNLHAPPDLQSLAFEVDLPKAVLKEGFYYLYGKTISQYLQDYKFEHATTMLESGKYLIKEVAFAIGYQNPSHFISAFKQRYGTTPKQWLKQSSPQ
ncbi:MAG: AraC family transcriptional regulator [Saprospiraceae bacterium]|nr:AraC family transcriptional regulator [Saprospiraceae bacterium]